MQRVAMFAQKVEQNAWIEIARPRSHHQAAERAKTHRRIDRSPVPYRGEARAVTKVRDDHPAARALGTKFVNDRFVREAVESVSAHALGPQLPRQRQALRDAGMRR